MITPGSYDITIYTGSSFEMVVTLKDSEGVAVDITDRTIKSECWNEHRTSKYFDFVVATINAAEGSFSLTLTPETTAALPMMSGKLGTYDVLVEEPNGEKYYWLQGDVYADAGVTRYA